MFLQSAFNINIKGIRGLARWIGRAEKTRRAAKLIDKVENTGSYPKYRKNFTSATLHKSKPKSAFQMRSLSRNRSRLRLADKLPISATGFQA